ncbi:MAG: hypothetical protein WBA97_28070 [Actinophytocola sp.]|uniref:hypothetical protein n=1 Tax=Actinophytocola sp. TaxID=1872138 RepID=UPI003C715DFF
MGFARWTLGIGLGLIVVAVTCSVLDLIPAAVITGVVGLVAVSMAVYGAVDTWAERAQQRRQAVRNQRDGQHR